MNTIIKSLHEGCNGSGDLLNQKHAIVTELVAIKFSLWLQEGHFSYDGNGIWSGIGYKFTTEELFKKHSKSMYTRDIEKHF